MSITDQLQDQTCDTMCVQPKAQSQPVLIDPSSCIQHTEVNIRTRVPSHGKENISRNLIYIPNILFYFKNVLENENFIIKKLHKLVTFPLK
jgi:hypothetical protein